MKIAFLGWGSLILCPRCLKIKGSWNTDGPFLPIEFARVSKDKTLTLVLYRDADDVQTLWAYASHTDLLEAIKNICQREETSLKNIGFISIPDSQSHCNVIPEVLNRIKHWAKGKRLDAVVWTDLPLKFKEVTGMDFNEDNVLGSLRGLKGDTLNKAKTYVMKAPRQIVTKTRRRIEN